MPQFFFVTFFIWLLVFQIHSLPVKSFDLLILLYYTIKRDYGNNYGFKMIN